MARVDFYCIVLYVVQSICPGYVRKCAVVGSKVG
jgi:hypothetical protein